MAAGHFSAACGAGFPGPIGPRPVYAPAMVAYVGGASFGVGVVGWFPLGPREVFVPAYGVSAVYMTRINVTNTVVTEVAIRNGAAGVVYANRAVPGAVVAVRGEALVGGRPIAAAAIRVPPGAIERAEVMHAAPVAPERSAVLGGRAPLAGPHLPPAAVVNRPVVAKMAPPRAPVPFARQQEALHANPGKPLDAGAVRDLQSGQPAARPNVRSNATPARPEARPETREEKQAERPAAKKTSKPAKKTTRGS